MNDFVKEYVIESKNLRQKIFCKVTADDRCTVETENGVSYKQLKLASANTANARIQRELHVVKKLFGEILTNVEEKK